MQAGRQIINRISLPIFYGAIGYGLGEASQVAIHVSDPLKVVAGIVAATTSIVEKQFEVRNKIKIITLVFLNTLASILAFDAIISLKNLDFTILGSAIGLLITTVFMRNLSEWEQRFHLSAVYSAISQAQYFALKQKISSENVALIGGSIAGLYYSIFGDMPRPNQTRAERIQNKALQFLQFFDFTTLGGLAFQGAVSLLTNKLSNNSLR